MLMTLRAFLRLFSPVQILLFGFVALAFLGAALLTLPFANADRSWQPFLDALFTSASAVTTTGLTVTNTADQYTLFGELVIIGLVQIGGLGYMTLLAFVMHLLGHKLSLHSGNLMEESLAMPSRGEMRDFIRRAINFTLLFESIGAVALTLFWLREYPPAEALYLGIFHSISAFCTAGFSLFSDGFIAYQDDWFFNMTINVISFSGAVGFIILSEAWVALKKLVNNLPHYLSVHSKLALIVSGALIVTGTAVFWFAEPGGNLRAATFQTITASTTTGFNTVEIANLNDTILVMLAFLMFVGAPAGGTGGGIKSTTFGVLLLFLWSFMKGNLDVNIFRRRLARPTLLKSVGIGITAVFWLIPTTLILTATESARFIDVLFEAVSALGTVGLSTGITPLLSNTGKIVIITTMIVGRVGPLTLAFTVFRSPRPAAFRYPREEVFVG